MNCAKNLYKTKSLFNSHCSSIYKVYVVHWQTDGIAFDLDDKSETMESGK